MAAIGNYGEALYQQVIPLHGPDPDGLAHDYMRWRALVVGVALRQQRNGETDATYATYARDAIRRQQGKDRGTVDAQISAVQDTLTGTKYANLLERVGGDAYAATMVVRASECPSSAATLAAWLNVDEGTRTIDASANTIDAAALADVT
jgi:hypothetical protein